MTLRVLFVDDESNVLDALQRMLRPLRREWEMRFANGGRQALALLDECPADVLVTDMRMPGMDGDELLAAVSQQHPLTVRIVLTGQCSREAMVRLASLAHQVLVKPCDPVQLKVVVQRACGLRAFLHCERLAAVVTRLGSIPSLPTVYARIVEELAQPEPPLDVISDLVNQDVGIAAKLIQIASSAMFSPRQRITTAIQALCVLGTEMTKTLVLAAGIFSLYDPSALKPFSIEAVWGHSRQVSELAARIAGAEQAGPEIVRETTLAGLIHDIGRITLASQLPESYKEVFEIVADERLAVVDAEMRVFGATHAEVGAYLLGLWGLPDTLIDAVAFHHNPLRSPGGSSIPLLALHAAEAILGTDEKTEYDLDYIKHTGLSDRQAAWRKLAQGCRA